MTLENSQITRSHSDTFSSVQTKVVKRQNLTTLSLTIFYLVFVSSVVELKSVSHSLFLSFHPFTQLPYLYILVALFISVATFALARPLTHRNPIFLLQWALLCSLLGYFGFFILVSAQISWSYPLLYIAGELYPTVINVLFWALVGSLFDSQTAKRSFGIIGAGGMAGATVSGILIRQWAAHIHSQWWILLGLVSILVCLFILFFWIERTVTRQLSKPITPLSGSVRRGLEYLKKDSYPKQIALLVVLLSLFGAVIDYLFSEAITGRFERNSQKLTEIFGELNAYVGIFSIVFQIFLTQKILRRYGVFFYLTMIPIACFCMAGMTFISSGFFWFFLLKFFEMCGAYSINQSGIQLLFNPIPSEARAASRAFIDGAIKKSGAAFGGVFILLITFFSPVLLSPAMIIILTAFILYNIFHLQSSYAQALTAKLSRTRYQTKIPTIDAFDKATQATLVQALYSAESVKVMNSLMVYKKTHAFDIEPHLSHLLSHDSEKVRIEAVKIIKRQRDPRFLEQILKLLSSETRRVKAEAIRVIAVLAPAQKKELIRPFLQSTDPGLVCAAIASLLYEESQDGHAHRRLQQLLSLGKNGSAPERRETAKLLGELPVQYHEHLVTYLEDFDISVQKLALIAAGKSKNLILIPTLLQLLANRKVRIEAREALIQYGDQAVPSVRKGLDDYNLHISIRLQFPRLLRLIGTETAAQAFLFSNIDDDPYLRYLIGKELANVHKNHPYLKMDRARLDAASMRRLRAYKIYLPVWLDLHLCGEKYRLLAKALFGRVKQNLEIGMKLLSIYRDRDRILQAFHCIIDEDQSQRADGIELLHVALSGDPIRSDLVEIFETPVWEGNPVNAFSRIKTLAFSKDELLSILSRRILADLHESIIETSSNIRGSRKMSDEIVNRIFLLESVDLFSGLSVDELAEIAGIAYEKQFKPNEVIFEEGGPGEAMFIITNGSVIISKHKRTLMELKEKDSFGQVSLLDKGRHPASAIAGIKGVQLIVLEREPFMDLVADRVEILHGLFTVLTRRLRELIDLTDTSKPKKTKAPTT